MILQQPEPMNGILLQLHANPTVLQQIKPNNGLFSAFRPIFQQ
jgi:hypothetical protein